MASSNGLESQLRISAWILANPWSVGRALDPGPPTELHRPQDEVSKIMEIVFVEDPHPFQIRKVDLLFHTSNLQVSA